MVILFRWIVDLMNGFYGDSAYTFPVGECRRGNFELMKRTKESLYQGIELASAGKRVGDIGFAVQNYVESLVILL